MSWRPQCRWAGRIYLDDWKAVLAYRFKGTKLPKDFGKSYLIATIFAVIYFIAPIGIYFDAPQYEFYVTSYGAVGTFRYRIGDLTSLEGETASKMDVDGSRALKSFGDKNKLVAVAFHHIHTGDALDEAGVSKAVYRI